MARLHTVSIVGVGLIGGSIGKGLLERGLADRVIGIGRNRRNLLVARRVGAITDIARSLESCVADADLVLICTPVGDIPSRVRAVAAACREGTLVTDVGSTKSQIVSELDGRLPRGVRFVGSHPLAGSENSGAVWSDEHLLDGRVVVLTPTPKTRREDVETLTRFWNGLGAKVLRMSPAEHDRALAATSHLPHLVAAALAAATRQRDFAVAAGGWLDTTRVAAGDPDLWRSIFATNRANALKALARFEKTLSMLRDALQSGDDQALVKILATGKRNRDAVGS